MIDVIDDYHAWEAYPQYRWVFNKLELSLRLGYHAGPAGIPVKHTGWYIVRPIYNAYGRGIGAHKKWLDADWYDDMSNHHHIPPGYFWCEWLEGEHYSIDYKRGKNWKGNTDWIPFNACQGFHKSEDNLTKFDRWLIIDPPDIALPSWVHDIDVKELNIEFKGDKITEIHLRSGNDICLVSNIGDEIYPVWQGDDYANMQHLEFIPNLSKQEEDYTASGNLKDIRLGYYRKINTQ